jgi:Competence protein CoiA-like family
MIRYATINGEKTLPLPGGRAACPMCGNGMIAKCGQLNVHHWAHEAAEDCDGWSEGIGPWHLSWQETVAKEFVEVQIGEHRADILGNSNTIIELQHSSISPDEIRSRECYYGNMLWVFDATHRFCGVKSGERWFFAFGRSQHIKECTKPVYLDFGEFIVQVEAMTDVFRRFSGFGLMRDREWFVERFLSERRHSGPVPPPLKSADTAADPWPGKPPWQLTRHASVWLEADGREKRILPRKTLYVPLDYCLVDRGKNTKRPVWYDVIRKHPEIANGWTEPALREMIELLNGTPMILGGLLRLMPSRAEQIVVRHNNDRVRRLLHELDGHVRAGRIPVVKESTRSLLLERAKMNDYPTIGKTHYLLGPASG